MYMTVYTYDNKVHTTDAVRPQWPKGQCPSMVFLSSPSFHLSHEMYNTVYTCISMHMEKYVVYTTYIHVYTRIYFYIVQYTCNLGHACR